MTDASANPAQPPLRAAIIPVTPLQQNCTLFWCTETMKGALVDPGGDLPKLKAAVAQAGVTLEKLLVTHGHIDHCGETGTLAKELGLPIEGPHEEDRFWISRLDDDGRKEVQQRLKALGFYDAPVSGAVGPKTRKAISDYQKRAGIEVNGEASAELLKHLRGG